MLALGVRQLFLLLLLHASAFSIFLPGPPAEEVANRAVPTVLTAMENSNWNHFRNFGSWSYEGGHIVRGLWDLLTVLPSQELETKLHEHLNHFVEDPQEFGYRILHNESLTYNDTSSVLPWLYSIGDNIGLFPIAFADRLERATLTDLWKAEEDRWIVQQVVERYIYGYPWHLPDGTISRWISWPAEGFLEPRALTVWVDDMFMGTALLAAWSRISGEVEHLDYAAGQVLRLTEYLHRGENKDNLLHHGFNYWTGHISCCKWARGNGWAFLATTELLNTAQQLGVQLPQIEALYKRHALGLLNAQAIGGGWHNILTNSSTFVETSATAMFFVGLSQGLQNGWLEEVKGVEESMDMAWQVIASSVEADGTISGIIGGTGVQDREEQYTPSSLDYSKAAPGVGAVLRAIAEAKKLQQI